MIKGFYAAASAMLSGMYRQEVLSHNVANIDTPGFKQILTSMEDFMTTEAYTTPGVVGSPSLRHLGSLGLGVEMAEDTIDFSQGAMNATGHDLDIAIEGPGFFRIQTPEGERYTRDGRMVRDADGKLVTVDGFPYLSKNGQPITIEQGIVSVTREGLISVNGEEAGSLGIAVFEDPGAVLTRTSGNYFQSTGAPGTQNGGVILQGYLEASNANPTRLMTHMVEVLRSYQAAQQMVQNQDELLGRSISVLGRIG